MIKTYIPDVDLENVIGDLDVGFASLAGCSVSPGWRLRFAPNRLPAIHYALQGDGRLRIDGMSTVPLHPATLIIVPPGCTFSLEGKPCGDETPFDGTVDVSTHSKARENLYCYNAGSEAPALTLICGTFKALFGASIELFARLKTVVAEHFDSDDEIEKRLSCALVELTSNRIGAIAMSNASLKQVLILLVRRSLRSPDRWTERFAALSDPQIARAFSEMLARPGRPHSLRSLSRVAGLSRSAFITRFVTAFADNPMTVLRKLRLRRARSLLVANKLTLDGAAKAVGFSSRASLYRALRNAAGERAADGD
jgi:AraC family transcriptional activator of mtrCDE